MPEGIWRTAHAVHGGQTMIHIALVEDDPTVRRELEGYLTRFSEEADERFSVRTFDDGGDIVSGYNAELNVILMDIQMEYMDGMTAAEEIRKIDPAVCIIFITNLSSYAVKGYAVDALDYLVKPVSYYAFSQSLRRALERLCRRNRRYLCINYKNGVRKVDCARIYFIEVNGHNLIYHTMDGDFPALGSMRGVEADLCGLPFFRCNKGYLINLEHVDGMIGADAMIHGIRIQISRSKKQAFLEALNRYINEVCK